VRRFFTLLQIPPSLDATPAEVNFGDVPLGLFGVQEVTLTNTSSALVGSVSLRVSTRGTAEIDQIVPDSSSVFFATVSHGRLTVWDAATGFRLAELPDMGYLRSAAFSPDDRYLLAGYDENSAALWLWRIFPGNPIGKPVRICPPTESLADRRSTCDGYPVVLELFDLYVTVGRVDG
jgi:WD40 repeat protein